VRKPFLLAALATSVALIVFVGMYASAQGPGAYPARQPATQAYSGSPIALVDVSYIFKEHLRFKSKMTDMAEDVKRAETNVKTRRDEVIRLAEQLRDLRAGTPDYKALEAEVAKRQADLSVAVQLQKKDFLQREAKIYYETYEEVLSAVDYFAKKNSIAMVLRFNGDPANMDDPQSVLQHINKPVVWYAQDRDITNLVLTDLNRPGPNPSSNPINNRIGVNPAPYTPRTN